MGSFEIDWKRSSFHDLKKIDRRYISRIVNAIESPANDPFLSSRRNLWIRNQVIVYESGITGLYIRLIQKRKW